MSIHMKNNHGIYKLSEKFYDSYPRPQYKEILKKKDRPYNCMIISMENGYMISIPYRSNIKHRYAYLFKDTERSVESSSGLDYSKMVIIKDESYIGEEAIVDKDEYKETLRNMDRINREATSFLEEYILYIKDESKLHEMEINRRYKFSPLQYFHEELMLEEVKVKIL